MLRKQLSHGHCLTPWATECLLHPDLKDTPCGNWVTARRLLRNARAQYCVARAAPPSHSQSCLRDWQSAFFTPQPTDAALTGEGPRGPLEGHRGPSKGHPGSFERTPGSFERTPGSFRRAPGSFKRTPGVLLKDPGVL